MQEIPSNSIDTIFADPPYNLQLNQGANQLHRPQGDIVEGVHDQWDKFLSFTEYDKFTAKWLFECHRILKTEGTIWVSGTYHNIFRIGKTIQDLDFWLLNDVIWVKNNPMPNFLGRRFCSAHETLIWAVKEQGASFTFNYKSMKSLNGGSQMRSDWRIPICQGKERIKTEGKKAHSTQKPEALLYRIILASTKPDDIILDPFFGTGTTGAVAKLLGRNYIGIEQNTDYIKVAKQRITKVKPSLNSFTDITNTTQKIEISFGALVEKGMIRPGSFLYLPNGKSKTRVLANGQLRFKRKVGSIHTIARLASGMEGMNGWVYWQVKTRDKFVSLDELRKLYEMVCVEQASGARPSGAVSFSIRLYKLAQIEGFLSENELEKFKYLITAEYQDLNERGRRLYAAQQVLDFGWGGQRYVAKFLAISRDTIRRGLKEIEQGDLLEELPIDRQRQKQVKKN